MKCVIGIDKGSYLFSPGAPNVGTIAILNMPPIDLNQINIIVNVTDGVIIYNFADGITGTINNNTITLTSDTSTMSYDDDLKIIIDVDEEVLDDIDDLTRYDFLTTADMTNLMGDLADKITNILGTGTLLGLSGGMKTENYYQDKSYTGTITGANSQFGIVLNSIPFVIIQIAGTWAGTLTFECTANNGDWVAIFGYLPGSTTPALTTTAGGIFKFNTTGLNGIRARMSAYTSGNPFITITTSNAPSAPNIPYQVQALGSQTQSLSQKATSFELNTYDTNLVTVLGTSTVVNPQAQPIPIAPVAPTANAGAVGNMFANSPQIFPRVRVEAAGSEKLPFAQEKYTNRLQTVSDSSDILLRQILTQLKVLNCLYMQFLDRNGFPNLQVPQGYEDILTKITEKGD